MNFDKLKETLRLHKLWLNNEEGGVQANLQCADLQGANLRYANLRYANLQNANLRFANLRDAWVNIGNREIEL